MNELSLVFDRPAEAWNEALPLGNGSMGAMSYGQLRKEKVELNLDTLWSGTGRDKENKNTKHLAAKHGNETAITNSNSTSRNPAVIISAPASVTLPTINKEISVAT